MSPRSVGEICKIARERSIDFSDVVDLSDDEAYGLLFPHQGIDEDVFAAPDYDWVHKEYARRGVTLRLLYDEYRDRCDAEGTLPCGKTKFNEGYRAYTTAKTSRETTTIRPQSAQRSTGPVVFCGPCWQTENR